MTDRRDDIADVDAAATIRVVYGTEVSTFAHSDLDGKYQLVDRHHAVIVPVADASLGWNTLREHAWSDERE
jgi:hypothetical protein